MYNRRQRKRAKARKFPVDQLRTINIGTRSQITTMDENTPPSGYRHLSDVEVMKCLTLAKCGMSQRAIAAEVKCSKSTVGRILQDYDYETFTTRKPHPGCAHKTSIEDDRHLVITAKRNYDLPLRDITNLSGLDISIKTTARRLKEVNLVSRYAHRKPFLKPRHKRERLEWANRYKDWSVDDWKKVVFSDECLLKVGADPQRRRVIREAGSALQNRYLLPTFRSGRVTIMIWACFSGERLGPLMALEQGGIGAEEYIEVLCDGLFSMVDDLMEPPEEPGTIRVADGNILLFMHDNATCHTAKEVTDLLHDYAIPVMQRPPRSPDLNPIENLWRELKVRFYQKWQSLRASPSASQTSFEKYSEMIQECWQEINWRYIQSLIESMPRRCAAVIAARGGHIKY